MHCCDSHLPVPGTALGANTTGVAHTPTEPSEQTRPQNSRYTPRCPSGSKPKAALAALLGRLEAAAVDVADVKASWK
jgi:hypothetical protein